MRNSGMGQTAVTPRHSQLAHNSINTFFFLKPITITIEYRDSDVITVDEDTLKLRYWAGQEWRDAGTTCGTSGPGYNNDPNNNILQVSVCHFTRFATSGN